MPKRPIEATSEASSPKPLYSRTQVNTAGVALADTVLVRVASIDTLRAAYPSYFADTRVFVDQLKCAIG